MFLEQAQNINLRSSAALLRGKGGGGIPLLFSDEPAKKGRRVRISFCARLQGFCRFWPPSRLGREKGMTCHADAQPLWPRLGACTRHAGLWSRGPLWPLPLPSIPPGSLPPSPTQGIHLWGEDSGEELFLSAPPTQESLPSPEHSLSALQDYRQC